MKRLGLILLRVFTAFDWPLLLILILFTLLGLTVMHSAVGSTDWRFAEQSRNFLIAFAAMWAMALVPPNTLMKLALPFYVLGVILLLGVEFFGETSKGATRWLNLGVTRIQPSEMMKIAVPMMLAWYFQRHDGAVRIRDFFVAAAMLAAPFVLIVLQPDLGTALLVFGAGFFVIYFAGLSFKLLVPCLLAGIIAIGTLIYYEDQLCEPEVDWVVLHDYQKHRVCTLLNPSSDPLGKGFHTIQSMIAVGSGACTARATCRARRHTWTSSPSAPPISSSPCTPRSSACMAGWRCWCCTACSWRAAWRSPRGPRRSSAACWPAPSR